MAGPLLHWMGMQGLLAPLLSYHILPMIYFQGSTLLEGASVLELQGPSHRGQGVAKLTSTVVSLPSLASMDPDGLLQSQNCRVHSHGVQSLLAQPPYCAWGICALQ